MARALKVVIHLPSGCQDESLRAAALQIDGVRVVAEIQSEDEFSTRLRHHRPDVLLTHLGDSDPQAQMARMADRVKPHEGVAVIAIGPSDDAALLRAALRLGVRDIIASPVDAEKLLECLASVVDQAGEKKLGRLLSVRGTGGGSGGTTVAVNLAAELAQLIDGRVAIVDLDLRFGQVASMFDLTPAFTIADLSAENGELEQSVLENAMSEHKPTGVWVLARPRDPDAGADVGLVRIEAVLSALPEFFDIVIVDENSRSNMTNRMLLNMADGLVIVTQPVVTSIRNTGEMFRSCESLGFDLDRTKLVLNRIRKKAGGLKLETIEKNLKRKVDLQIPEDAETVCEGVNLGQPLRNSAPNSKVRSTIRELATSLTQASSAGAAAGGESKGFFSSFFGG